MKAVGLRDLKNRLSEYVRWVRAGEVVLVTDRGEVVAELRPPGESVVRDHPHPALLDLVRQGQATLGAPNDPSAYPPLSRVVSEGSAARLLDEERGEK